MRYSVGTRNYDHPSGKVFVVLREPLVEGVVPPGAAVRSYPDEMTAKALAALLNDPVLWERTANRLETGAVSDAPMMEATTAGQDVPLVVGVGTPGACVVCDGNDAERRWGPHRIHDLCAVLVEEVSRKLGRV
jgi:hypothetical protein